MEEKVVRKVLIFCTILLLEGVCFPLSIHANQSQELSFTDFSNDVLDAKTGRMMSRPNIDIYIISATKVDVLAEVKLQLVPEGIIQNNTTTYYEIYLTTDTNSYMAFYGGGEIGVIDKDDNELDVVAYSGEGENILSISFNLSNSDETLENLTSVSFQFSVDTEEGYYDEYPNPAYKKFLFGKYTNMLADKDFITIESVNIRIMTQGRFRPFRHFHVIEGEQIVFSKSYQGIITNQFIIGYFNVYKY